MAAASSTNDPEGSTDADGYLTPRSIETPVGGGHHLSHVGHLTKSSSAYPETGFSSSSHQIRDPYRVPQNLRLSNKSTKSDGDEQNLHTQKHHSRDTHIHYKSQIAQNQTTSTQNQNRNHNRHQKSENSHQKTDSSLHTSDHDKVESDNEENSIDILYFFNYRWNDMYVLNRRFDYEKWNKY